jgi:hypothetical protein
VARNVDPDHLRLSDNSRLGLAIPLRTNPASARPSGAMRQSALEKIPTLDMDIERINLIGSGLADLAARTEALRGYL